MRKLWYIPALLWMVMIFALSAMPEDISGEQSREVAFSLQRLAVHLFGEEEESVWEDGEPSFSVRKPAHMAEYAVLVILVCLGLHKNKLPHVLPCGSIISIFYACTDEVHQLFVPGRSGEVRDVAIDVLGILLGLVLILFFRRAGIPKARTEGK